MRKSRRGTPGLISVWDAYAWTSEQRVLDNGEQRRARALWGGFAEACALQGPGRQTREPTGRTAHGSVLVQG
jgi:hypothetical protein